MTGGGKIRAEMNGVFYMVYAKYLIKFIEEYKNKGVDFWGITLMNEPDIGANLTWRWPATYLSPEQQR